MKVLIINGSPRGRFSVTLQSCLYLEQTFPEHEFEFLNAGSGIHVFERDMSGATEAIAVAMRYLTNMGLSLPMLYLIYVYRSNLQSIGDSFWSMVSGFTETLARVGTARLVMRWIGRDALFFTEPAAWFAAWTTVMIPYYFYRKKHLPMEDR